jgi:hypothetical protein
LFSFWKQSDETTYAVIFNEKGQDISNRFFADSLNYKIGKIKAGISDVFDDVNNDGYIDILPIHGIGFKYKNQYSYFLFNPKIKKYELKKLHNYTIIFDSDHSSTDSLAFWPDYDYKSHTTFLQYFNKRKDQDVLFTNVIAYKMNCGFAPRPQLSYSTAGLCLQNDSLLVSLKSVNSNSSYSISYNNKSSSFNSKTNLSVFNALGSVYITETNNEGCVLTSDTLIITKKSIPSAPTISSGSALTFCAGGNVVLTSSSTSNQWYLNGAAIKSATGVSLTVNTSGEYAVKAMNGECSSPLSPATKVVVNTIPGIPSITQEPNGNLTSSSSDWNQWYLNDVKIENAIQKSITPSQSGNYTVKVISPCGTEVSKAINVVITATEETILGQVQGSPNPTLSHITLTFPVDFGRSVHVSLLDVSGVLLFEKSSVLDGEEIDLSHLHMGNYVLQIQSNDNSNLKLIKISKIQ